MFAILKKELHGYFYSPLAYVLFGIMMFISSLLFMSQIMSPQTPGRLVFGYLLYYIAMMLTFIVPILTMRVFAEERKNNTEVLLITSPVNVWKIVLGKYLAALTVFLVMTVLTLVYPLIISVMGKLNMLPAISSYIGFVLIGAVFMAFGIFASAITENQIVAAVIGVISLFSTLLINMFLDVLPGKLYEFTKWISVFDRLFELIQGVFNLSNIVFFVSLIALFIALTMIVIEKRRWSQG